MTRVRTRADGLFLVLKARDMANEFLGLAALSLYRRIARRLRVAAGLDGTGSVATTASRHR